MLGPWSVRGPRSVVHPLVHPSSLRGTKDQGPRPGLRIGLAASITAAAVVLSSSPGQAHKPITSPYTYNEDVFPLLHDRCGRCHVSGGVAPMSLMTHADTVPWGESIKTELLAGSMPPWSVDSSPGRFRNVEGLTAREMNVLLTWVTGGTPLGDDNKGPKPTAIDTAWRLGAPDLTVQMPSPFSLNADTRETTAEFTLATGLRERRLVRAVDLQPGTPSIVRAATVSVKSTGAPGTDGVERVLALWLPGDDPVPLDQGFGFELPAGAELTLRVLYRKTWEYERKEMTDRSTLGIYFADANAAPVDRIDFSGTFAGTPNSGVELGRVLDRDIRALAIYPESRVPAGTSVRAIARRPDGSTVDLIAFHPRPDWERRYWFTEPIALPKGSRINISAKIDDEGPLLPLSTAPAASTRVDPSSLRVTLDVVAAR